MYQVEGGPTISMLELKFILFIDFPKTMAPGVFVSCADDIEFFESQGMMILLFALSSSRISSSLNNQQVATSLDQGSLQWRIQPQQR